MTQPRTYLINWPLTATGEPLLQNSEDAMYYAQLIYDQPNKQAVLAACRKALRKSNKIELEHTDPDFDRLMIRATRAQFYRECLEECKRIREDK